MEKFYYVGVGSSREVLELDVETAVICFVARFLGIPCSGLTFVRSRSASGSFRLAGSPEYFGGEFDLDDVRSFESRPLPFARDVRSGVNYVGLCTVLRFVVKSKAEFLHLLDEHQKCFKACAETSKWTDLCENKLLRATRSCIEDPSGCRTVEELLRVFGLLEDQLSRPPVVSNVNKRRRDAERRDGQPEVDLLRIHPYMGGLDFLLLDLVICCYLVMILQVNYSFYSDHLDEFPRLFAWFSRTTERDDVKAAAVEVLGYVPVTNSRSWDAAYIVENSSGDARIVNKNKPAKVSEQLVEEIIEKVSAGGFVPLENHLAQFTSHLKSKAVIPDDCLSEIQEILPYKRFARKCEQLKNLILPVFLMARLNRGPCKVVDFCCGSGYLGVALSSLLPECRVILIENKEESLSRALPILWKRTTRSLEGKGDSSILQEMRVNDSNVEIYQCNLEHFQEEFDVGVCLHGCGLVTDLVLQKCIRNMASFVICPCCYGAIKDGDYSSYPKSHELANLLCYDEYSILAHASDQPATGGRDLAKKCMTLVDSDRLLGAQASGYDTWLFTMDPPSCTPKNNLLIGIHRKNPSHPVIVELFNLI